MQIENCVEEWKDGHFQSIDFTEKLYREKYESYLSNLEEWGRHPQGKFILARLQQRLHDNAWYVSHCIYVVSANSEVSLQNALWGGTPSEPYANRAQAHA
jgi:Domain of unknown function (DUF6532)